jgi:glutathione S-transferase
MLVLRSSAASPFGRKVRIAAAMLDLEAEMEVVEADTGNPDDTLRRQNPLGKIPALVLETGDVLFDSAVIVEYLDWRAGGGKIIPAEPSLRFRALARASLADGICDAAVLLRYETIWREPDARCQKWVDHQSGKISRALAAFEAEPPDEIGDIATIALASALGYLDLRFGGEWRPGHPKLVKWLEAFAEAAPAYSATAVRL